MSNHLMPEIKEKHKYESLLISICANNDATAAYSVCFGTYTQTNVNKYVGRYNEGTQQGQGII